MGCWTKPGLCDFTIAVNWGATHCERPAVGRWHPGSEEEFCKIHINGIPDEFETEAEYNEFWSTARG